MTPPLQKKSFESQFPRRSGGKRREAPRVVLGLLTEQSPACRLHVLGVRPTCLRRRDARRMDVLVDHDLGDGFWCRLHAKVIDSAITPSIRSSVSREMATGCPLAVR
jgi:hypothetical protein